MPIEFEFSDDAEETEVEEEADEEIEEEDDEGEDEEDSDEFEETESEEFEEIEFSMTKGEINEWINELMRLKEEKESANLQIDDELSLKINYEGEEEEE